MLLTEHYLEFLGLKEAAQACLSLQLSKCHIVGNRVVKTDLLTPLCEHPLSHLGIPKRLSAVQV